MKRYLTALVLVICFAAAGNAQSSVASAQPLAEKIAQRMKDSLSLTLIEHDRIFAINMAIAGEKNSIWASLNNSLKADSMRKLIQRAENKRDSLYGAALPQAKYEMYKQRKPQLIRN